MSAPKLRNDCFAMPPGVDWTPVPEALDRLRAGVSAVVETEEVGLWDAAGRRLARSLEAPRAHPPFTNAAVDGYAFSHADLPQAGEARLPLADGRAAAGSAYDGPLPKGHALRILTGAAVPAGADTIVLDEDTARDAGHVTFGVGLKRGANTRPAGEDIAAGAALLSPGQCLRPGDLAVLASTGVSRVPVYRRLRVGVLSTGTEIVETGAAAGPADIYDANRPMLTAVLRAWGAEAVDLGHVPDDAGAVRSALDRGAAETDAVLTSGGASAGDEDHISAELKRAGGLNTWRIALKPGRPLALGLWGGVPVFGLPGNPVAAFVCTLLFARPALSVMAGGSWEAPEAIPLVADFEKRKKPGRTEYLRARRVGGKAQVFHSEGSGRVTGLSWADGLVRLDHERGPVTPGETVDYLPFSAFGL